MIFGNKQQSPILKSLFGSSQPMMSPANNGQGASVDEDDDNPPWIDDALQEYQKNSTTKDDMKTAGLKYSEAKPMEDFASISGLMGIQSPVHPNLRPTAQRQQSRQQSLTPGVDKYLSGLMGVR